MVQFLSIFFFLDFFNFCWGFQKFQFFCVTLYKSVVSYTNPCWSKMIRVSSVIPICLRSTHRLGHQRPRAILLNVF